MFKRQPFYIERTLFELGDHAAKLTDEVMMMVLRKLVARSIAKVQTTYEPETPQQVQGPVNRHETHFWTPSTYAFEALVLLRFQCIQNRDPLRRGLVTSPPHLSYGCS